MLKVWNKKHGLTDFIDQKGKLTHKQIVKFMLNEDKPLYESIISLAEINTDNFYNDISTFI